MLGLTDPQLKIIVTAASSGATFFLQRARRLATAEDKVPERPVELVAERSAHNVAGNFV
jgi:hypothetical protein